MPPTDRPAAGRIFTQVRPPGTRALWTVLAVGPALIVLLFAATTYRGVIAARASRDAVRHSRDLIANTATALSALQDAETGQRGYLLTGAEPYLQPYRDAQARLGADTTALRRLLASDSLQARRLDTLGALVRRKMAELEQTISLRRAGNTAAAVALVGGGRGKATMDSIREVVAALSGEEQARLERRSADEAASSRVVMLVLVFGSVGAAILCLLLGMSLYRAASFEAKAVRTLEVQQHELRQQSTELENQSQLLQQQATELEMQNADLQDQTTELEAQAQELERTAKELAEETRVAERARETAEAANRAKSDFMAMMSHELRTPLNAIAGYAQLMQLGVPDPVSATHREYLDRIQTSQHHLLGIINAVLNFARLEAGSVVYVMDDVVVAELLDAIEPLIGPQTQAKGLQYICVPCERSLLVRADTDKVTQILLNLISNAVKFTPAGGQITLAAMAAERAGHETVAFKVSDTGIGIPADKREAIFDPFVQVDQTLTRTTDGAGLGLAISRELARGMGGDLECETTGTSGSVFTLHLERLPYAATA